MKENKIFLYQRRFSLVEGSAKQIILGLMASIALALCAKIQFYLSISPVPFVMQNTLLLFFAAGLGRKGALAMVLAFLGQGAFGLPVFAGGVGGLAILLGPAGGYLVGYAVAAFCVAWLQEKRDCHSSRTLFIDIALGGFVIYFFGALHLATFLGGLSKAIVVGVIPFVLTDLIKVAALTTLASLVTRSHSSV